MRPAHSRNAKTPSTPFGADTLNMFHRRANECLAGEFRINIQQIFFIKV